jgi:hypothetical protein
MRDDAPPSQPKSGKDLTVPSICICQTWVPHESGIVAMLANSDLYHSVLALVRVCRKKKSNEKKLERLKHIIGLSGAKRKDAGLCLTNVDGVISSRAISRKGIPRYLLQISVWPRIPTG